MKRVKTNSETENTFKLRVPSKSFENKKFNEMKTTNNVQKAILKSLAVIVSFVLISFTVSAQGFWESILGNNTFNEIALAMVDINSESDVNTEFNGEMDANTFAAFLEEETEEALELEDWMTNDANFTAAFSIETEVEESMEVEDWMIDEAYFAPEPVSEKDNVELKRLDLKSTNGEVVIKGDYIIGENFIYHNVNEVEKGLQLESWMLNSKVWRN